MKKMMLTLLVLVTICLVGCGNNVTASSLNTNAKCKMVGISTSLLAYDENTNVVYIRNYVDYSFLYTPYYDENGNSVIYEGQELNFGLKSIDATLVYDTYTKIVYLNNSTFSEQNLIATPYYNSDGSLCWYDENTNQILALGKDAM